MNEVCFYVHNMHIASCWLYINQTIQTMAAQWLNLFAQPSLRKYMGYNKALCNQTTQIMQREFKIPIQLVYSQFGNLHRAKVSEFCTNLLTLYFINIYIRATWSPSADRSHYWESSLHLKVAQPTVNASSRRCNHTTTSNIMVNMNIRCAH